MDNDETGWESDIEMKCDYFCRVKTCEIFRKENWEKIQDIEEGEIFWQCEYVPIPKIDLVDFVFTHISECIELKEFYEPDKEFLTGMENKINSFIQSRYFRIKENRSKVFKVSGEFLKWKMMEAEWKKTEANSEKTVSVMVAATQEGTKTAAAAAGEANKKVVDNVTMKDMENN